MKQLLTTAYLLFLCCVSLMAQSEKDLPARPQPPRLVVDYTGTLTADQSQALEQKLVAFNDSTSSQIAVVVMGTTGDYDIADYAVALGRFWGVGSKEFNNGIVLLVAKEDRKMWIATGYGLEGALPDALAKRIIENEIKPNFRENDFYRGLDQGTDAIIGAIKGEYTSPEHHTRGDDDDGPIGFFIILIVIIYIIYVIKKGGGGGGTYHRRGRHHFPAIWWLPSGGSSLGGRSSWGGGSSGGGFGGFGGGSFGGGGAGGSW